MTYLSTFALGKRAVLAVTALTLAVTLPACSGGQGPNEQSTYGSLPNVSNRMPTRTRRVPQTLPPNLLYAGVCADFKASYCTQFGVNVYDADATTNNPAPLYTITQGIVTGPSAYYLASPEVAVDDSGNLYVGTPNGFIYGSQPGEVLVYPPGQVQPSATLTGIPDVSAIAASKKGDVAVEASDGSVYTFAPGTTSPQRTIVCSKNKSEFTGPGGIGYAKNGDLFFGENYSGIGSIFRLARGVTKCRKAILVNNNPYNATNVDATTLIIGRGQLFFVAGNGPSFMAYFTKGSPNPSFADWVYSTDTSDGIALNSSYLWFSDGFGVVGRVSSSCLFASAGCSTGISYNTDYPNTVAVYPRAPLGKW
jgi:hypothetical protein